MKAEQLIRRVAVTSLLGAWVILLIGSAGAAPTRQAGFWSVGRCEQVFERHNYALPTIDAHTFHVGLVACVGAGGSNACRWTSGHRSRLYSEFTVLTRARYVGGILRSFTIATRALPSFVKIGPRSAAARYSGLPAYFYLSRGSIRILASTSTTARFRSVAALMASHRTRAAKTADCA